MRDVFRRWGWAAAAAGIICLATCVAAPPARAQGTITYPQWILDSGSVENKYLVLWEYFRGGQETRFNIWTGSLGNPLIDGDEFGYFVTIDTNGNRTVVWPWGTRLISGMRPTRRIANAGDDRPYANALTLRVEDAASMTGFTNYILPDDGRANFAPPIITLPQFQGFYSPYTVPTAPAATGPNLTVTQKHSFARDLVRIEVIVKNEGGTARRVGARLLLDTFVEEWGPTRTFYLPGTNERIFFEKEYRNAQVPDEWEIYDFDEPTQFNPTGAFTFAAKGILKGNGATSPSKVIFGNTLDMWPFALQTANWDWVTRPDFELRIADMGLFIYWEPVSIPAGQQRTFVTYAGLAGANHGMSNAYQALQATGSTSQSQGYIAAAQSPYAIPLINACADKQELRMDAYVQNEYLDASLPNAFAFIDLPDGLQFGASDPNQTQRLEIGTLAALGTGLDEGSGSWSLQANGIEAGRLPVTLTFSNGFLDSTRVTRIINVPQGKKYQFTDDWNMLSFPFTYAANQDDPAEALGLAPGTFQIVQYNPLTNSYELVDRLRPGRGYWVRMLGLGRTVVNLQNPTPVKLTSRDVFTSQILRGWNQVGNPSPYAVALRDIRFLSSGGVIISFDQAVAQGLVRPGLFEWNRKTLRYDQLTKESTVAPGKGIWIFSFGERNIVWPNPQGPQISITP